MLPLFDEEYTNCSQPWHFPPVGVQVATGLEPLQVCVSKILLFSCREKEFGVAPAVLHDGFTGQTSVLGLQGTSHSLVTPLTESNEPSASMMWPVTTAEESVPAPPTVCFRIIPGRFGG